MLYDIEFEVDGNFSLDKLRRDLWELTRSPGTSVMITLWVPGGVGTAVRVQTDDREDERRFRVYALERWGGLK